MAMVPAARPTPAFFKKERLSTFLSPVRFVVSELPGDYSQSGRKWNKDLPPPLPAVIHRHRCESVASHFHLFDQD
jgi:hypothetical protein